jgi:hypothetical protein
MMCVNRVSCSSKRSRESGLLCFVVKVWTYITNRSGK